MALALSLGQRGAGNTWPNPSVGCVLVKGERLIARGWTQPGGRPHAERVAIDATTKGPEGATAYVTLEPCAHHGQTPPCAEALVEAGVSRVVIAASDPDERVAGRGVKILRDAGIEVTEGVLEPEARLAHRGFFKRLATGRPYLTLKFASSLDGRIATASGESQWITGALARGRVQALRMTSDVVMVGGETARADDPRLTVRGMATKRQPARAIVSSSLELPRGGAMEAAIEDAPLWLFHSPDETQSRKSYWEDAGARLFEIGASSSGLLACDELLSSLGANGVNEVLCEGGGQLAASLLRADLVDEIVHFQAGLFLGQTGRPSIGDLAFEALSDAQRFQLVDIEVLGPDTVSVWRKEQL